MYELQRCRSHEFHNTPRAWEFIRRGPESVIVGAFHSAITPFPASGDHYRIVDESGEEQAVLSETMCGPAY